MVATERVIAQTDLVAVFLSCFWIYPTGFEFKVFVDTKDKESELDPFEFGRRHRGKDLDELSTERASTRLPICRRHQGHECEQRLRVDRGDRIEAPAASR